MSDKSFDAAWDEFLKTVQPSLLSSELHGGRVLQAFHAGWKAARAPATAPATRCRCGRDLIRHGPDDTDPWCEGCSMSASVCDCVLL